MILLYGLVSSMHGVKGEVQIGLSQSRLASLPSLSPGLDVYIGQTKKCYRINSVKIKPKAVVLALDGVCSIEQAMLLKGMDVFVETNDLPALDDDTFYEGELVGFSVVDSNGLKCGEITHCYSAPAHAVLEIIDKQGNITPVPFVSEYFGVVSRTMRTIEIKDTEFFYQ